MSEENYHSLCGHFKVLAFDSHEFCVLCSTRKIQVQTVEGQNILAPPLCIDGRKCNFCKSWTSDEYNQYLHSVKRVISETVSELDKEDVVDSPLTIPLTQPDGLQETQEEAGEDATKTTPGTSTQQTVSPKISDEAIARIVASNKVKQMLDQQDRLYEQSQSAMSNVATISRLPYMYNPTPLPTGYNFFGDHASDSQAVICMNPNVGYHNRPNIFTGLISEGDSAMYRNIQIDSSAGAKGSQNQFNGKSGLHNIASATTSQAVDSTAHLQGKQQTEGDGQERARNRPAPAKSRETSTNFNATEMTSSHVTSQGETSR